MPAFIQKIEIARPATLGSGSWKLSNLRNVTVIVGKNGSGKSILLRSWRDQSHDQVHYVVPERTGEMDFQPNYVSEEMQGASRRNTSGRNFATEYRRRIVGRVQTYFMFRGNHRGDSAPPGNPEEIENLLHLLISDFSIRFQPGNPPYKLTRESNQESITQVDQLSSGEAQLLTIGLDVLTIASIWELENRQERIILLDEPDAHIHPDLQARFADFIFKVGEKYKIQFVIATHSTSLLSALGQFGGEKTGVIYLNRGSDTFIAKTFDSVAREVAACLGGHVLMGPLFGAPLLLVEGDDDYRIWSQVPRHHITNIAVIPTNGDEIRRYQKYLETILGSLSEPSSTPLGYALLDGDKPIPIPNPDNKQQFVKYIGLSCHESENLYLTNEVLALLNLTWPEAAKAISDAHASFREGSALAAAASEWDRKTVDIKCIISDIAKLLDPKGLIWSQRVGVALGRARPSGEMAEFLGATVVAALWR